MKDQGKVRRNTKQRRVICEIVMNRRDHPSADEIYSDVHENDRRISKATVYRNLNILSLEGDIQRVKVPGADRYDSTLERHYHVICTICGTVIDSPIKYDADSDDFVGERTGFRILRHRTVFEGICAECLKKAEEDDALHEESDGGDENA